jgi:hypothetical protein
MAAQLEMVLPPIKTYSPFFINALFSCQMAVFAVASGKKSKISGRWF